MHILRFNNFVNYKIGNWTYVGPMGVDLACLYVGTEYGSTAICIDIAFY